MSGALATRKRRTYTPEAMNNLRIAAAKARGESYIRVYDPADYPYPIGETVEATFEDVAMWAAENGIVWKSWDDLARINEVRSRAVNPVLLPFERHWPRKGIRG